MDISHTIIAKSDQLNACDLLGGPITVRVEDVRVKNGTNDQPVAIVIGDGRQPFKPCLTVRRILAKLWGCDSAKWVGQYMTLYCDESVRWAGEEVGGIRVSHATGINSKQEITVRASKHTVTKAIIMPLDMNLPSYPDNDLQQNSRQWRELIASGRATAEKIIAKISRDYALTDEQKAHIRSLESPKEESGQPFTHAQIMDKIQKAPTKDDVDEAESLGSYLPADYKKEIAAAADVRRGQLEGAA